MTITPAQFESLLEQREDERLEFKEAKQNIDSGDILDYCVALANGGGGKLVLGVSDSRPRQVVGTSVCRDPDKTREQVFQKLRFHVEVQEIRYGDKRVVILTVPSRPRGVPLENDGRYLMRSGERLVAMTQDVLRRIFEENHPGDFSSQICRGASHTDLSPEAVQRLREMLSRAGNERLVEESDEHLLADLELVLPAGVTYAALILLGTEQALRQHVPGAEVIFEYRADKSTTSYQQRKTFREGFFLWFQSLWSMIDSRNEVRQFQDGLFVWNIPTFNERVVREAINNAICHREYRSYGAVFVRQSPTRLMVESPGGFIENITPENILWRQAWRNRRIAEVLDRCRMVERSGQGVDLMFEESIREGKDPPDFSGTDDSHVVLALNGEIQDVQFLRFLERVSKERGVSFGVEDLLVLDSLHWDRPLQERLESRVPYLREQAVIERVGKGRGTRYILSRKFYDFLDKPGVYTRKRGLDRPTNKALLLDHIRRYGAEGSRMQDLVELLHHLTRGQVRSLLRELQQDGGIHHTGRTKASRWFPGSSGEKSED